MNSNIILRLKVNDRMYLDYGKIELSVVRVGKHVNLLFDYYNDSGGGGVMTFIFFFCFVLQMRTRCIAL